MNFTMRTNGNIGIEILGPDGKVIAWAIDELVGATLCHLLNGCKQDEFLDLINEELK
jgi:hypothetical protein